MSTEEKKEMKEMVHDLLVGYQARMESQTSIIDMKIDQLINQTMSIDNRVKELEKHPGSCSLAGKVRVIEDQLLARTSVKKWVFTSVGVTSAVFGMLVTILKLVGVL